jgi:hypothetical protein
MTTKTMRTVIVSQGFRGNIVTIAGRKYEVEKLTKTSQRRLHAVLESVPAANRCVELESDFTPTVYLYFYKTAKPTLAEQQSAFLCNMLASGKGWSDCTPEEVKAARAMGFYVPTFTPYCPTERVTISWKVL